MVIQVIITHPQLPKKNLWRVYHDIELSKLKVKPLWRPGMPEVHPLFDNHHSEFQRWAQLVSFGMNPWFANMKDRWRDIYDFKFAFANNQGFRMEDDPRADFINMWDITAELPRVEALLSGGSLVEGVKNGDWVTVKGLHFDTPVTLEYVKAHPQFWVRGTYVGESGKVFRMLGDKYEGEAFIHPLIVNNNKGELRVQANKLQPWTNTTPPDPLKIYI